MRNIRLKLDSEHPEKNGVGIDSNTDRNPTAWQGYGLSVDLGAFHDSEVRDLTGFTALELMIRPDQTTAVNLAYDTIPFPSNAVITDNEWTAGTNQHARFVFPANEMNIELNGLTSKRLWLVVKALDATGESTVLGTAWFTLVESNSEAAGLPPENPGPAITEAVAAGLFAPLGGGDHGFQFILNPDGGYDLALWNQDQDIYQRVRITGDVDEEAITFIT